MQKNAIFALTLASLGIEAAQTPPVVFNEIIPSITNATTAIPQDEPVCFIFAHGRGGNKNNVHYYHRHTIVRDPFFSFNFPDAANGIINYKETSLAQDNEIAAFKDAYDHICAELELKLGKIPPIVLTGVSRGASSVITFMGTHNPEHVCALVIESPFDTVHSIITGMLKKLGLAKSEVLQKWGHEWMAKVHAKYNKHAPTPLDMVQKIKNKDLPILIICSKKDELIPWSSSYRLYTEFKNQDFKNVHILVSSHGKHVKILESRHASLYKEAVNAFYKQYLNI